ncbi:hypothetical protein ACVWYF_000924, partial [Hymenobacter sp. UYAg731]
FFPLFPVPAIGSAKVSKSFELTSKQGKFLFFVRFTFQVFPASYRSGVQR